MRSWTIVRSRLARAVQTGAPADHIAELRRELACARAADSLRNLMLTDPPPTRAQRAELAAILIGDER